MNARIDNSRAQSADQVRVAIADESIDYSDGLSAYLAEAPSISVVAQIVRMPDLIDTARRSAPHVVILDTASEGSNPVETIRRLTDSDAGVGAHVLVLTSPTAKRPYSVEVDARNALTSGATSYVFKRRGYRGLVAAVHHTASDLSVVEPSLMRQLICGPNVDDQATNEISARLGTLTSRELDILGLLGRGWSNTEISKYFGTARTTTKNQVSSILRKLDLRDRVQAAIVARDLGVEPSDQIRGVASQ